jgi:hypothetical protein
VGIILNLSSAILYPLPSILKPVMVAPSYHGLRAGEKGRRCKQKRLSFVKRIEVRMMSEQGMPYKRMPETPVPMPLSYELIPLVVALIFGLALVWGEVWLWKTGSDQKPHESKQETLLKF